MSSDLAPPRSILFFPGLRPGLHPKAVASGADAVCLDLEDAVPPDGKDEARRIAVELLSGRTRNGTEEGTEVARCPTFVRVNDPTTELGRRDLRALADADRPPEGLLIPKVEAPGPLERIADRWGPDGDGIPLLVLVETARGLEEAGRIATARAPVSALILGGVDLTAELGGDGGWESLLYARSRLVHAAALGRTHAVDAPFLRIEEIDGLRDEARRARRLGFGGKLAVHPAQVEAIHEAFTPTLEEAARARRIVEAFEDAGGGVVEVDGRMVDLPVVEAARRTLALRDRDADRSGGA